MSGDMVKPCPSDTQMAERACANAAQCWEPCGQLGKSAEHARVADVQLGVWAQKTSLIDFNSANTWVMRITPDRRIEVNDGVEVTEAAQAVLDAVQSLLTPNTLAGAGKPMVDGVNAELLAALIALLDRYTGLVNSGDAGNWDAETESEVIAARAIITKAEAAMQPAIQHLPADDTEGGAA